LLSVIKSLRKLASCRNIIARYTAKKTNEYAKERRFDTFKARKRTTYIYAVRKCWRKI